ncbi:MAG TPA: hypothetical protein VEW05_24465, partial [Candidatus Polarisedimenticolia bacterium]|nr:hypothetical protein [Candidatus Polarisedimenticolia bacterium]
KQGTILNVFDQGGEPHTFTEVAQFGGGFLPVLNAPGEETVPECAGGFSNVAVAKTRILQGSQRQITGLSRGEHLFECCIHPWMRVKVEVKRPVTRERKRARAGALEEADIAEERLTDRAEANHLALIRLAKPFANLLFR